MASIPQILINRNRHSDVVAIWPLDSIKHGYLTAFDRNSFSWIHPSNPKNVLVTFLDNLLDNTTVTPHFILQHPDPIGLILSNERNNLMAFDDNSCVYIWCLKTLTLKSILNTSSVLNAIMSMNVTGDRLIAGGDNGCVGIWEISTCKLIASIPPHHSYDPENHPGRGLAYNVAIWDNYAVYGTRNGIHVVYDLETRTIQNEFDILNIVNHRDEKKESDKEKKDIKIPRSLLETRNCSFPLQPPAIVNPKSEFLIQGKGIQDNDDSDEDQIEYEFNGNDDGTLEDLNFQLEEDINAPITFNRAGAEDHEANMENRLIFHHADFNNFAPLEEDMIAENIQPLDSLIPRTLSMNSHILITNAIPEIHIKNGNCIQNGRLSVWDYRKGKHLYYLNENVLHRDSKWLQNGNFLADISLAEISKDSSIIYASSMLEDDTVDFDLAQEMKIRLSVWDFLGTGPNQKSYPGLKVERRELKTPDGLMGYDVWVLSRDNKV